MGSMEGTMEHKLIIKSLHDAQVECACGRWSLVRTGTSSREELQHEWERHVERYVPKPVYVKCPKCGCESFTEKTREYCTQTFMRVTEEGEHDYEMAGPVKVTGIDTEIEGYSCDGCLQDVAFLENDQGKLKARALNDDGTLAERRGAGDEADDKGVGAAVQENRVTEER
jgi:hypothetical protein